jgi:arylsulfatase A-like enzyme
MSSRSTARTRTPALLAGAVAIGTLFAGVLAATTATPSAAAPPGAPNILLFMTDDQRDRGSMGVMPKTREIFSAGTKFRNAFVTTPQCCPSRASIYSGRYVHNHLAFSNRVATDFLHEDSWPRYLNDAGYQTALYGKFLNGWNADVPHFDDYAFEQDPGHSYPKGPPGRDLWIADRAIEFIDDAGSGPGAEPWAVTLSFRVPHLPFKPEEKYAHAKLPPFPTNAAMRERDYSDKNPELRKAQRKDSPGSLTNRQARRGQLTMQMTTDDAIQNVWNEVVQNGHADDTLAIFVSDNGYYWGEHDLIGKFLPYLDSLRVPMYMRWDGHVPGDTIDGRLVANIDIAPTIYAATGITPEYQPDGRSLLDYEWDREWLMFEGAGVSNHNRWPSWRRAYYDGRHHLIKWSDGFREHYNLGRDPEELESTLDPTLPRKKRQAAKKRVERFEALLRDARNCVGPDWCP